MQAWAAEEGRRHEGLLRLGYFGSYARGDSGVGSDLDIVAVVAESDQPFWRRAIDWDLLSLPVPAEILVYTAAEWNNLQERGGRFAAVLEDETVWVFEAAKA